MQENNNIDRINELIASFFEKGLSAEERTELKRMLADPDNKRYFREAYTIELVARNMKPDNHLGAAYDRIMDTIKEQSHDRPAQQKRRYLLIWRNVAAIALFIISCWAAYEWGSHDDSFADGITVVNAPLGSKSVLSLPDGSVVTLNSGSSIAYMKSFGDKERKIELHGEAFLDVQKDNKPFIVSAKGTEITVLGTSFNVKAYDDEDIVETTLVRGAVKVKPDAGQDIPEVYLKPNETVLICKKNKEDIQVEFRKDVNTLLYTSWKDPKWIIQKETLESIVKKLERKYKVRISIEDEQLKHYKFTGILMDETIQQTFDLMRDTAPIDYAWEQGIIKIRVDKKRSKDFEKIIND
ncbi:FecR family protein [Bacteroides sp.]|uniref:FecR family protein n=1 Tax=Bacteroides sp. TaxID=29523 RepID=UPI0025BF4715|nr:FecR domain-containing protein [Bacteroides sp.]